MIKIHCHENNMRNITVILETDISDCLFTNILTITATKYVFGTSIIM